VITIHQRYRQTDRRTTCNRKTALCTKVHCAVKTDRYHDRTTAIFRMSLLIATWRLSFFWAASLNASSMLSTCLPISFTPVCRFIRRIRIASAGSRFFEAWLSVDCRQSVITHQWWGIVSNSSSSSSILGSVEQGMSHCCEWMNREMDVRIDARHKPIATKQTH